MRVPRTMWSLETLGRVRLSKYFYMREFLYSEIGNIHQIPNIPENPDLAIERGRAFCTTILDPLEETFGRVAVRSGYRSPTLNRFGNENVSVSWMRRERSNLPRVTTSGSGITTILATQGSLRQRLTGLLANGVVTGLCHGTSASCRRWTERACARPSIERMFVPWTRQMTPDRRAGMTPDRRAGMT